MKGRAAVPENLEGPLRSRVAMVVMVVVGGGVRLAHALVGCWPRVLEGGLGEERRGERESARHFDGNSYSIV